MRPNGIDALGARIVSGTVSWFNTDNQGSVRLITSASGSALDEINYDAWGNKTSESDPSAGSRYGYTGREADSNLGLQYNRDRWYDAVTGTWTTQDPDGFDAGDSNLNRYVQNGPTNATDPSGQELLANDQATAAAYATHLEKLGVTGFTVQRALSGRWIFHYGEGTRTAIRTASNAAKTEARKTRGETIQFLNRLANDAYWMEIHATPLGAKRWVTQDIGMWHFVSKAITVAGEARMKSPEGPRMDNLALDAMLSASTHLELYIEDGLIKARDTNPSETEKLSVNANHWAKELTYKDADPKLKLSEVAKAESIATRSRRWTRPPVR